MIQFLRFTGFTLLLLLAVKFSIAQQDSSAVINTSFITKIRTVWHRPKAAVHGADKPLPGNDVDEYYHRSPQIGEFDERKRLRLWPTLRPDSLRDNRVLPPVS